MSPKKPTKPADPMSDARRKLEKWIFDENRVVTSSYLLRNTELDVLQVQELMESFCSENVAKNLSSTYFIIGEIDDPEAENDGVACVNKTIVCNQQNLEETKTKFKSINTCSRYSLQAKPVEDYAVLYNVRHEMEGYPYVMPSKDKLLFCHQRADRIHTRWEESTEDREKLKDIKMKKMKQDKMMENANLVDGKKLEGTAPWKKKNVQKVTIDSEEEQRKTQKQPQVEEQEPERMEVDEGTSAQGTTNMFGSNMNDIFSTGIDSSPEKEVQPTRKSRKSPPPKKRKSQSKTTSEPKQSARVIHSDDEEDDSQVDDREKILAEQDAQIEEEPVAPPQSQTATTFRKEVVEESFVDDEGYTVTQLVPKLVETEVETVPQNRPATPSVLKPSNAANAKKAAKAAKVNPNQPKISNFFTKK